MTANTRRKSSEAVRITTTDRTPSKPRVPAGPASAASAGYLALGHVYHSGNAAVSRDFPEVCEEVDEVQEADPDPSRSRARATRRSLRKAMKVSGHSHNVVPFHGLTRRLAKVTDSPAQAAPEAVSRQAPEATCRSAAKPPPTSPPRAATAAKAAGRRRAPRSARGISARGMRQKSRPAPENPPMLYSPMLEDYRMYSPATLEMMAQVSEIRASVESHASHSRFTKRMGRSSASSAQRLLTSRIQLSREQEWALIRVVQHRQKLKELADALRAQGKACSMGDVAVLAGMSGGEQELLMLEQLSQDATDMVMSASMRLAMSVAGRYSCAEGMTYEDLIPYSLKGLEKAMYKFDTNKGIKFSTYAHWWIRQAVNRAVSVESRVIKLPSHLIETIGRVKKEMAAVASDPEIGERDAIEAVAARLSMTPARVLAAVQYAQQPVSMGEVYGAQGQSGEEALESLDVQPISSSREATTSDRLNLSSRDYEMQEVVEQVLCKLTPRERHIIKMRYGLTSSSEKTMSFLQIGKAYSRTQERIRQIELRAMRKVKHLVKERQASLIQYLD